MWKYLNIPGGFFLKRGLSSEGVQKPFPGSLFLALLFSVAWRKSSSRRQLTHRTLWDRCFNPAKQLLSYNLAAVRWLPVCDVGSVQLSADGAAGPALRLPGPWLDCSRPFIQVLDNIHKRFRSPSLFLWDQKLTNYWGYEAEISKRTLIPVMSPN